MKIEEKEYQKYNKRASVNTSIQALFFYLFFLWMVDGRRLLIKKKVKTKIEKKEQIRIFDYNFLNLARKHTAFQLCHLSCFDVE